MNRAMHTRRICFAGAGSMAEAIIKGLIDTQLVKAEQISVVNRSNVQRLDELHERYGVHIPNQDHDREQLIRQADIIILAMKPKDAQQAIQAIVPAVRVDQLLISVIAGLSISSIASMVGQQVPIARTMPNTSSMIGLGATGICFSDQVTQADQDAAIAIFESVGIVKVVDEALLDAVTGVSGSGPAYIYYVMEAMIQGGITCGLTPETAKELTVQTVLGAAKMVMQTGEEPEVLRRRVTSPGGTTEAALELMANERLQETVTRAVQRAAERAQELGKQSN